MTGGMQNARPLNEYGIAKIWWLWVPLFVLIAQVIAEATLPPVWRAWTMQENGPEELGQFVILIAAFGISLTILRRFPFRLKPWLGAYLILAALCCFYVAGEEESWGQWFFHWPTPAQWALLNNQNETNLHNNSSWLDQKPRLLLEVAVMAGGILIPLCQKFRPQWLPSKFAIIYPPAILSVDAGIDLFLKLSNTAGNHLLHRHLYERVAEFQETYMYYFVLLYLIVLKRRIFGWPIKPQGVSIDV